jgi:hypothetical protein
MPRPPCAVARGAFRDRRDTGNAEPIRRLNHADPSAGRASAAPRELASVARIGPQRRRRPVERLAGLARRDLGAARHRGPATESASAAWFATAPLDVPCCRAGTDAGGALGREALDAAESGLTKRRPDDSITPCNRKPRSAAVASAMGHQRTLAAHQDTCKENMASANTRGERHPLIHAVKGQDSVPLFFGRCKNKPVTVCTDVRDYLPDAEKFKFQCGRSMAEAAQCWVAARGTFLDQLRTW